MNIITNISEYIIILNAFIAVFLKSRYKAHYFQYVICLSLVFESSYLYAETDIPVHCIFRPCIILAYLLFIRFLNNRDIFHHALLSISVAGGLIAINANDIFTICIALELSLIPIYIAVYRNKSSLDYIKYGILSSSIQIAAISLICGNIGSTDLSEIHTLASSPMCIVGVVMLLLSLVIKFAIFPFNGWLIKITESKDNDSNIFFILSVQKTVFVVVFCRMFYVSFIDIIPQYIDYMFAVGMILSGLYAVRSSDIRQFLAYVSIEHAAFILCGIVNISDESVIGINIFAVTELIVYTGMYGILYTIEQKQHIRVSNMQQLVNITKEDKLTSASLAFIVLTFACLPPFIGFFGKYYILISLTEKIFLQSLCILSMLISGIYVQKIYQYVRRRLNLGSKY